MRVYTPIKISTAPTIARTTPPKYIKEDDPATLSTIHPIATRNAPLMIDSTAFAIVLARASSSSNVPTFASGILGVRIV
jgi:hypothetical protein